MSVESEPRNLIAQRDLLASTAGQRTECVCGHRIEDHANSERPESTACNECTEGNCTEFDRYDGPRTACGWCAIALGEDSCTLILRTMEDACSHALSCQNNPLVRQASVLCHLLDQRAEFDVLNTGAIGDALRVLRKTLDL